MELITHNLKDFTIREIQNASLYIKIIIPENTYKDILLALINAKKKGVSIELVIEYYQSDREDFLFDNEITELFSKLYDLGSVLVYKEVSKSSNICEKFCLIDKNILIIANHCWDNILEVSKGSIFLLKRDGNDAVYNLYEQRYIDLKNKSHYDDINIRSQISLSNKSSIYKSKEIEHEKYSKPSLIPFQNENNLWGFYSSDNNDIIVEPIYANAYPFSDGLACIKKRDEKNSLFQDESVIYADYAFINNAGKIVTDFVFYAPSNPFSFGWAPVRIRQYTNTRFSMWDCFGSIDYSGNIILPFIYGYLGVLSEGKAVYGSNRDIGSFLGEFEINRYGVIDADGNLVMPSRFEIVKPFSEGMAVVGNYYDEMLYPKYGFINEFGNLTIDIQYNSADRFSCGRAKVRDRSINFIDKKGLKLFDDDYLVDAESFKNGLAYINAKDGFSGLVNTQGDKIMNAKISKSFRIVTNYYNNIAIYTDGSKYGFVDKDNNLVTSCIYNQLESPRHGVALAHGNGFKAYLSVLGETIYRTEDSNIELEPFTYYLGKIIKGKSVIYITYDGKVFNKQK